MEVAASISAINEVLRKIAGITHPKHGNSRYAPEEKLFCDRIYKEQEVNKMKKRYEPPGRSVEEVLESLREAFFKKNGYYGTKEVAVWLTEEARKEIREEKAQKRMAAPKNNIRIYKT